MRRWRTAAGALLSAGILVLAGCASGTPEPSAAPETGGSATTPDSSASASAGLSGTALKLDQIGTSPNMRLVANVPLGAPFERGEDWGTDLAFQGDYVFTGNYEGFTVHDISDPTKPKIVSRVHCPGGQNDISVTGHLLILSIDEPRSGDTCESGRGDPLSGWEGLRIFDISDKAKPRYVKAIPTSCGSHTHTLVPGKGDNKDKVYVYVSSFGPLPGAPNCQPPHDSISIVEVPLDAPQEAKVVAQPVLFADGGLTENEVGEEGADTTGCHDITVYPEKDLAAGACLGNGILMDISDPVHPRVLQEVSDTENFSIWHWAIFDNDAERVVFGDELGGGVAPTCDRGTGPTRGADAVYDITPDRKLRRRGFFKIPREQTQSENCVAHNGSLIPVPGKDIMVQSWYLGGVSVIDFSDPDRPKEIGYFERGPLGEDEGGIGGSWSAYYYNGYIYSSDITKGLDVIRIDDPLTDPAAKVTMKELNAQTQTSYPES
ncbi:hypothetical protein AB0K60_13815 [Thermopolyspora sp. NPDC052614]|uniref:LVIVD repeat-containing protein n=1 Tax=Thermopolyspora sp. NPDC052614 TaxID=3155682 RepID=UPI0034183641